MWLTVIRHLDRRVPKTRAAALQASGSKTKMHAVQLRLEGGIWENREDRTKAAEILDRATRAAPEYLQAWLLRIRVLKELGHKEQAAHEIDVAAKLAAALNLGEAAIREIRSIS